MLRLIQCRLMSSSRWRVSCLLLSHIGYTPPVCNRRAVMKQASLRTFFGTNDNKSRSDKGPLTLAEGNNGVQTSDNLLQKKGAVKTAAAASEGPLSASSSRSKATKAAQPSEQKAADVEAVNQSQPASTDSKVATDAALARPAYPAAEMHVKEPNDAEAVADAVKTALTRGVDTEAAKKKSESPQVTSSVRKRKRVADSDDDSASEPEKSASAGPQPNKKAVLKYVAPSRKVEGVGSGSMAAAAGHADFNLDEIAPWQQGKPVPFAYLAKAFELIGSDSRRLAKTQQLVNVFRGVIARTPEDLLPATYLCSNQVAPAHEGIELGIGDAILIKAVADATGRAQADVKKEYKVKGDLGTVASSSKGRQGTLSKPKPLTVQGVFKAFREIAKTEGQKSQDKKKSLINSLLVASQDSESSYIIRMLQGKLRIGLGAETLLVALAHAVLLHKEGGRSDKDLANRLEEASQAVKLAYSQCPSYDKLVPALLDHPVEELNQHVHFMAGVPIKPMLAKPTTGVSEVLDKLQDIEFTCEYKYDGERAQIHISEGRKVSIYSRNSENNTSKYPDLAAMLPQLVKDGVESVVLDAEAVAYDHEKHKILPFQVCYRLRGAALQVLSTRARKDVRVEDIKIRVCIFAFDCLYLNGEVLLQKPLTQRRAALRSALAEKEGELLFATAKTSTDLEELGQFLDESVAAGTEGLIVKTMDSTYEPSRRSAHWLKLKKDYLDGVGDTFDVVPIGAWHGKGKRQGVYGSYLLAVYNPEDESFETISKIGTGFSDEQLTQLSTLLNGHIIPAPLPYYRFGETLIPDVWFDASSVWEVKAADLSISPVHKAAQGLVDETKGISIRFPRLVRVREGVDKKTPEQATTSEQVKDMFLNQTLHSEKDKGKATQEADEY